MNNKKRMLPIVGAIVFCILLSGCEDKVTTVADDISSKTDEEYVTMEEFELKGPAPEERENIGYCAILIPSDYHKSESEEGMYVSDVYPLESSNIYYSVTDASSVGAIDTNLTKEKYEETLEDAYSSVGKHIDLVVDDFSREEFEGIPSYKIRSHYTPDGGKDIQQLCYIIMGSKTHVITYTQVSDDELMVDFLSDEGQIKLIRDVKGK